MDGLYMNTRIDVCVEVNHTRKARGLGNGRRQYNPTQRSVASLSDITLTSPCPWSLPSRSLLMPPPPPRALQALFFELATLRLFAPSTRRSSLRRSRRISFCVLFYCFVSSLNFSPMCRLRCSDSPDSPPISSRVCPAASCGLNSVATPSPAPAAATPAAVASAASTTGAVCSSAMAQRNRGVSTTRVTQASRQVSDSPDGIQRIAMSKDRAARYQGCVAGTRGSAQSPHTSSTSSLRPAWRHRTQRRVTEFPCAGVVCDKRQRHRPPTQHRGPRRIAAPPGGTMRGVQRYSTNDYRNRV